MVDEKKSERLEVRLGYAEKRGFVDACDSQGDTPSSALRRFIRGYVRRADNDMMSTAWRAAVRRRGPRRAMFMGVFVLIFVAGFAVLSLGPASHSDEAVFAALDLDGDGELTPGELRLDADTRDGASALLQVLDLDGSGALSLSEFQSAGRMAYAVEDRDDAVLGREGEPSPLTVVSFAIDVDRTRVDVFANAIVNAAAFDRLVVRYTDGSVTVMEGTVDIETRNGQLTLMGNSAIHFPPSVTVETGEDGVTRARRGEAPADP